jgi:hypothetical protein
MRFLIAALLWAVASFTAEANSLFPFQQTNIASGGGPIQVVQGASAGVDGGCYPTLTFNFARPVQAGSAIMGVLKTEDGFACTSPNGSPDTFSLGSQQATLLPRIAPGNFGLDSCCPNDIPFILFNASGGQTTFTVTNSGGGNFDGMGFITEVAGLGTGASVDKDTGSYSDPNGSTGADAVSSGTITPSQAHDFLYGFENPTYATLSAMSVGTGWTKGANDLNINGDSKHAALDEYILDYNSTSPIAATFGTTNATGEWPPGIIAIKPGVQTTVPVALLQSVSDTLASTGGSNFSLTTSAIPNGNAAFGAILWETCNNPSGQPGCTSSGGQLDHITIGSKTATILGTINDPRCQSSSACGGLVSGMGSGGLALTLFWLPNIQGNPTSVNFVATSGGNLWYDGSEVSIFSGIPANATIDGVNGLAYGGSGSWNGSCCSGGILTSLPVSPTQSGDFLYGAAAMYGCGPPNLGAGSGWNISNSSTNYFGKVDEWQIDNTTGAIGATFNTTCGTGTSAYAATIAVNNLGSPPPPPPPTASTFDITRNSGSLMGFSNNNFTATANTLSQYGGALAFTTTFHSSGVWNFRFNIGNCPSSPGCQVGLASALEANNANYLGHGGGHSVAVDSAGQVYINNQIITNGNTPSFTSGDVIDIKVDLNAKTIAASKNNGALGPTSSIASLAEFNLSPAVSADGVGEQFTFNGSPPVGFAGATLWDGGNAPAPTITAITPSSGNFTSSVSSGFVATLKMTLSNGADFCSNGGTLSITGTNSGGFQTVPCPTPQLVQSASGTPTGTYADFNVVATLPGGTPFAAAQDWVGAPAVVGGIACDIGPPYQGPIPPGAQRAGFTHCAANWDMTYGGNFTYNGNTYNFSNLASWLDVCGAGTPLWVSEQSDGVGGRAGCNAWSIVSDGSNPQVLQMHWDPSLLGSSDAFVTGMHASNGGPFQQYGNVQDFPMGAYWQARYRSSTASFANPANSGSPFTMAWWTWQAGYPEIEIDNQEVYAYDASTGAPVCGSVHCEAGTNARNYTLNSFYHIANQSSVGGGVFDSYDPTTYQTNGMLVTNDGSNIDVCSYNNDQFISCGGTWPYDPSQVNNRSYPIMYSGPQNNDGYNPGGPQDLFVTGMQIFTCANWQSGNHCINNPVLDAPSTQASTVYQPPGCQPGNHGAIRGRPRIASINGTPTLVADDGCLIVAYDGFATGQGYGPGGVFQNTTSYSYTGAAQGTNGVNLQWMQEVAAAGFNAVATPESIQADGQTDCHYGYPYSQTLSQFIPTMQTYVSLANQTGLYVIVQPTQCNQWETGNGGPAGPFNQSLNDAVWTSMAQNFGGNTNVFFVEGGEPEGFSNWSCSMEAGMSDRDYQTIRNNGGANTMFGAFSDFRFGLGVESNCGPYSNLTSQAPHINWNNAFISFSLLNADVPGSWAGEVAETAANGQAMWSYEGSEDPSDCGFGSHANAVTLKQALMAANTGWQCDDGWPNPYGPVSIFWTPD